MGALILLQITAVVLAYVYRGKVEKAVIKAGQDLIEQYDENKDVKSFFDAMQYDLMCCGVKVSDSARMFPTDHSLLLRRTLRTGLSM